MPSNPFKTVAQRVRRRLASVEYSVRQRLGIHEADDSLIKDSQEFWNDTNHAAFKSNAHFRDGSVFTGAAVDDEWSKLGREHLDLYRRFARALEPEGLRPPRRVLEWGCGGGANAVHFAPIAEQFIGVDIAQPTLDECGRQLQLAGLRDRYVPVLCDAANPEAVIEKVGAPCDLFLCTYVFELLPSPEYGLRILKIAKKLLAPGGLAVVQTKYHTADPQTWSRRWKYKDNLANTSKYGIDEFWTAAEACGFESKLLWLKPRQPLMKDGRYAYYALAA